MLRISFANVFNTPSLGVLCRKSHPLLCSALLSGQPFERSVFPVPDSFKHVSNTGFGLIRSIEMY